VLIQSAARWVAGVGEFVEDVGGVGAFADDVGGVGALADTVLGVDGSVAVGFGVDERAKVLDDVDQSIGGRSDSSGCVVRDDDEDNDDANLVFVLMVKVDLTFLSTKQIF
jgi:hypothetical protein